MLIGELSNKTGLSRDTIRFYEKNGFIKVNKKARRENNYKEYSDEVLQKLLNIKKLKGFGFTLNEISELIYLIERNKADCNTVTSFVDDKIKIIDQKIEELMNVKTLLLEKIECNQPLCNATIPEQNCPIFERELN
jgi:DNA-binding transcriptional MerR regulator